MTSEVNRHRVGSEDPTNVIHLQPVSDLQCDGERGVYGDWECIQTIRSNRGESSISLTRDNRSLAALETQSTRARPARRGSTNLSPTLDQPVWLADGLQLSLGPAAVIEEVQYPLRKLVTR
jgi:hypothetical protein